MQRPGNAGSFTATDHVKVLDAALAQIPTEHGSDLLVTIDGAGVSHAVIEHLTRWNTYRDHGRRGRRVECSIGWPSDLRVIGRRTPRPAPSRPRLPSRTGASVRYTPTHSRQPKSRGSANALTNMADRHHEVCRTGEPEHGGHDRDAPVDGFEHCQQ